MLAGIGKGGGTGPVLSLSCALPDPHRGGRTHRGTLWLLLLPVWVFYLLKDRVALTSQFDRALPGAWRFDIVGRARIVQRVFGQWVRGQLILGIAVGVFTFIGLTILSRLVDPVFGRYAMLLSVIAGVLELLPIIGPIISAIPAVLLAATAGLEPVIAALVLYTLVQQVENNLLVPKIQGDAVELHPAAVMFAIVIGGSLAGLLGAILALPIAAAFRDVVRYLFRRLSPDGPEALRSVAHRPRASSAIPGSRDRERPDRMSHRTPTRSCRSIPKPRTRSSRPPIAGWPANTTRTSRRARTALRGWWRSTPPGRWSATRTGGPPTIASGGRRGTRRRGPDGSTGRGSGRPPAGASAAGTDARSPARGRAPGPTPRPGDRVARLDDRPFDGRRRLRPIRCARRTGSARPVRRPATRRAASSTSAGTRAGRSARSPARPRLHRVARPDADRAARTATRSTRSSGAPAGGDPRNRDDTERRGLFRRR